MRIFLQPFVSGYLIGVINHIIEYPATGLVLIWTYNKTCTITFVFLLMEFFLPNILMQFRTGYTSIKGISPCVVIHRM